MSEESQVSRRTFLAALAAIPPLALAARSFAQGSPNSSASPSTLGHHVPPQLQMGTETIAILVYPQFTALDVIGPHYALSCMMGATVRFVAKDRAAVPAEGAAEMGLCVRPHWTFDDCPADLDLLLIPGGLVGTMAAIEDAATQRFVADRGGRAKCAGSVCTGSLILGAAGLLKGRKATSHWQTLNLLAELGATPVHERVVFDGEDRVTAAGVSAGIDLGLRLVQRFRGDFYAKGIQLLGEYDPQPPFPKAGNPDTADTTVVEMLRAMHQPLAQKFRDSLNIAKKRG